MSAQFDSFLLDRMFSANTLTADYDARLSEAGDYTPKCYLLRSLFSQYQCMLHENTYQLCNHEILNLSLLVFIVIINSCYSQGFSWSAFPQEQKVHDPVVIQLLLSLWDSLHFTNKVSFLYGVTADHTECKMLHSDSKHSVQTGAGALMYEVMSLKKTEHVCYQPASPLTACCSCYGERSHT